MADRITQLEQRVAELGQFIASISGQCAAIGAATGGLVSEVYTKPIPRTLLGEHLDRLYASMLGSSISQPCLDAYEGMADVLKGAMLAAPNIDGSIESGGRRDGSWWRTLTGPEKAVYVAGIWDGIAVADAAYAWQLTGALDMSALVPSPLECDSQCFRALATFGENVVEATRKERECDAAVTVGQVVQGLTQLYQDGRNLQILVRDALEVVMANIRGSDARQVDARLNHLLDEATGR